MKNYSFLFLIFIIIIMIIPSTPQNYEEFICPELSVNPREDQSQTGGLFKPASNLPGQYFKVYFVFVQFEGDTRPNPYWQPGSLPNWALDFIDSDPVSPGNEYRDMTLSDYWKEMSIGIFDFIGDVYPELVILPPESYYQQNNYNYVRCNLDVLTQIDPYVDFSIYENWMLQSGQFVFSPGIADNFVDMIYIIYRDPGSWFGGFTAIAHLGFGTFTTNDTNQNGSIKISGSFGSLGSGITVRQGLRGHIDLIERCAHEFGHYLFGSGHTNYGGIMGAGTYAMSGWERERLGYIAYTNVYQDNFSKTLTDFITTGDILRIPIPLDSLELAYYYF
jgi:M6 family metalloprotease-like protein